MSLSDNIKKTIAALTTDKLLELYNKHSGKKPAKKFSSRKAGEAQTLKAIEKANAVASVNVGVKAENKPAAAPKAAASLNPHRSEAIADSWKNKTVAAKRSLRHRVKVNGAEFRSVPTAIKELGLKIKNVIGFRQQVVANGKAEFDGHKFTLIGQE